MPRIFLTILFIFCTVFASAAESPKNFEKFFGEKIKISQTHSSRINQIILNVTLPPSHVLLAEIKTKPHLTFYNPAGKKLVTFNLLKPSQTFNLKRNLKFDKIFAELALYYCKEGDQGLCLMKNVLYEIPLDKTAKSFEDLILSLKVEDKY